MRRVVPLSVFYDEARSVFQRLALAVGFVTGAVIVAVLMSVVALLAAIGPARRILRIQTVEALRTEG